jgi:hypothetical protein
MLSFEKTSREKTLPARSAKDTSARSKKLRPNLQRSLIVGRTRFGGSKPIALRFQVEKKFPSSREEDRDG